MAPAVVSHENERTECSHELFLCGCKLKTLAVWLRGDPPPTHTHSHTHTPQVAGAEGRFPWEQVATLVVFSAGRERASWGGGGGESGFKKGSPSGGGVKCMPATA
jgi:hypothetical protein